MASRERRLGFLKWLDVYTKSADELKVRTATGAVVTALATILLVLLVVGEVSDFMEPFTSDAVVVDDRTRDMLTITVDIDFPGLPCNKANFDLVDDTGESSVPFIPRWNLRKDPLSQPKLSVMYCGSCDPQRATATTRKNAWFDRMRRSCCNTCDELKKHLASRKIDVAQAEISEQCLREKHNTAYSSTGGCRVYGTIDAPKVKANLHIAAGNATMQPHGGHSHHVHSLTQGDLKTFDITHNINELSFGPQFPKMVSPLRQVTFQATGPVQVLYMAQVVPTTYRTVNGFLTHSAQYSLTEHRRPIDLKGHLALPGLFLKYDIAPYRIVLSEEGRAVIPFLVRLCAVVGGIYTTAGLVYAIVGSVFSRKKRD